MVYFTNILWPALMKICSLAALVTRRPVRLPSRLMRMVAGASPDVVMPRQALLAAKLVFVVSRSLKSAAPSVFWVKT